MSRLILAFGLVVLFVVIANQAAMNGGIILRTERYAVAQPSQPVHAAVSFQRAAPSPAPSAPVDSLASLRSERLERIAGVLGALGSFENAAERRAEENTPRRVETMNRATAALNEQSASLARELTDTGAASEADTGGTSRVASAQDSRRAHDVAARAAADTRRLIEQTRVWVSQADARRQTSAAYWAALDALDTELKTALDRTWKILGRVIARESLLDMNRRADEIRRLSSSALMAGPLDSQSHEALARAQSALQSQLDDLIAKEGGAKAAPWMAQARTALASAVVARNELSRIDALSRTARDGMERSRTSLDAGLRRLMEMGHQADEVAASDSALAPAGATPDGTVAAGAASNPRDAAGAAATAKVAGDTAPHPAAVLPQTGKPDKRGTEATPANDASSPRTHTADDASSPATDADSTPPSNTRVTLLRWASGAVLLALLAVCFWIVSSVVRPVRAFVATIRRLSKGELSARFEPAGIRELDTLATAFNHMAEELARAQLKSREYQSELEQRVDERTRQLRHLADHDELTALPNRRQLTCYLDLALERAMRAGSRVGVFFIDLDNFKTINDSMGHAYGDLVLQAIAQRLRNSIPRNAFAARLGGDEFTMIVEAPSAAELLEVGHALAQAFQKPHVIEDRELVVGVSLGASLFPDHEEEAAALLRAADAALFSAKSAGRSRLAVFEPAMLEAASLKFRIEQGLRRAVERGEFELLFQPEVSLDGLDTCLVEALLRWRQPDGQYVSPGEFLIVAEESGLIMTISDWVMRAAIEQAAAWHHGPWPGVRVAINVSARQLLDPHFDERVSDLLTQYRLPPACIEIELTETVLQTGEATIVMLKRLRALGIAIALDDFGTGYSTLASIEQLPLTRVKMDRSLIAEIDRRSRSLAIARAIIALCRDLGLAVTAEGVERPEQLALLSAEPDLTLQGYLISSPIEARAIPDAVATMAERLQSLLLTMPAPATSEPSAESAEAAPARLVGGARTSRR